MTLKTALKTRFKPLFLVPILVAIALSSWALASPIGSSPDDDFHLVSSWCAPGVSAGCEEGTAPYNREVATGLLEAGCFNKDAEKSGSCQSRVDFAIDDTQLSERGNFVGGYPPVYYAVMGVFSGDDIIASALVMRFVSIIVFVVLTTLLFLLLPVNRRPALVWAWLITTIPLGMFLIASNNPSSWAIIGVGTSWLALVGWFETTGKRKIGLGALFVVTTIVAAGSRGDAAVYAILGIGVAGILSYAATKRFWIDAILPGALVVLCAYFFISANQVISGFNGFGGTADFTGTAGAGGDVVVETPNLFSLVFFNLLNVPSLWAGVFGHWGLGWLEVGMPAIVAFGSLAVFVALAFVGFGRLDWRKSLSLAGLGFSLIVLPVVVLTRGGDYVGSEVQPRYLLPLIVLFAGVLLFTRPGVRWSLTRGQTVLVGITLIAVQLISLHVTMRRYITGTDSQGWNLNAGAEWWWPMAVSPMVVFAVGSIAYAGVVVILLRAMRAPATIAAETREGVTA